MAYYEKKDEIKELRDKIKLDPEGAYLFWGEEEYLKHYYLDELRRIVTDEGMEDFNRTVIDFLHDGTLNDLDEAVDSLPIMAEHKIIEVWGINLSEIKGKDEKRLTNAVKRVSDGTILVIFCRSSELEFLNKKSRERALIKDLETSLTMTEFPRQSEQKLLSWTDKIFRVSEVRISDVNITRMIKLCDYSMTRLKNDSEKLIAYCKYNSLDVVPSEVIDLLVKPCAENEMWDFTDAVIRHSKRDALEILENLRTQNIDPIMIIAALGKTLNGLALLKSDSRGSDNDLAKLTGFFPWQIKKVLPYVGRWSVKQLREALELTFACEGDLKNGRAPEYSLLESLTVSILGE
ncbi:MAG: DNA polymerase III subunit delta [Ruminococcaceae bacterium]|nr:DNA polymerase III subunit delta [Oscillospiraceae bacterium]